MIRNIPHPSRIRPRLLTKRPFSSVKLVEVGPRDGLQNETTIVSTENKLALIDSLAAAGLSSIEATSFVSPKAIPALADAKEVMQGIQSKRSSEFRDNVKFSVLVPNVKYFNVAMEAEGGKAIDEIAIFGSASETFSQKNIRCSINDSLEKFRSVVDLAKESSIPVRGYVSCVLGCPYEGAIRPKVVSQLTERLLELGCREVSLGDTIGVGTAGSTRTLLDEVIPAVGGSPTPLAVHFHDTYGQALANILVSLEQDITVVDASVAGLGGCPYAGGSASGNVATEDVVYMLDGLGVETGTNLDRLVDAGDFICNVLGKKTTSKAAAAILSRRNREH